MTSITETGPIWNREGHHFTFISENLISEKPYNAGQPQRGCVLRLPASTTPAAAAKIQPASLKRQVPGPPVEGSSYPAEFMTVTLHPYSGWRTSIYLRQCIDPRSKDRIFIDQGFLQGLVPVGHSDLFRCAACSILLEPIVQ